MNNTDDNKNMIFFLIASMVLLFGYQFFYLGPQQKKAHDAQVAAAASASSSSVAGLALAPANLPVAQALLQSPRVPIDTPSLKGSIALKGALLDDLSLVQYHDKVDPKSPNVELLRPTKADHAYYVRSGFNMQNVPGAPTADTIWTLASGTILGVDKPVVLVYDAGNGLMFRRMLSIDKNYMISQQDTIINTGAASVSLAPYSMVIRTDMPQLSNAGAYVHEGNIVTFSDQIENGKPKRYITKQSKYHDLAKGKNFVEGASIGGWFGITDKYWMAAVIPDQKMKVNFRSRGDTVDNKPVFTSGYVDADTVTIPAGKQWSTELHIFAGAKHNKMLRAYENDLKLPRFENAIDWGILGFITYPFYLLLIWLDTTIGNMGLAILALTVIVKLAFFPLANKSYEQMMKMRHVQQHLQPKLDAIKKRFPDDPAKQQEATMALYQAEKVNPMAGLGGCLPMLLQLPVFICLFKVLQMSIEMRHAPFFGWINDLAGPDSTTLINLFGLLPFDPATVPLIGGFLAGPLHIGVAAILYGASMWASQQMTPMTGIDPMQKKMMAFMPLMMVFFFSQLAIGLMIYYTWSNLLTMLQQYLIMRRLKVENPIDGLITRIAGLLEKKAA